MAEWAIHEVPSQETVSALGSPHRMLYTVAWPETPRKLRKGKSQGQSWRGELEGLDAQGPYRTPVA